MLSPAIVALALSQGAAAAAVPTGDSVTPVTDLPSSHRYRSGLVVGLTLGVGLGGASGYPNNSSDIGNEADYSASGFMLGTSESIFLMGALSDYLSFGFMFAHGLFRNPTFYSNTDGVGFRIEGYPLAGLGPRWQGLGALAQFGLGTGDLVSKPPNLPEAEGTQSFGAMGIFYEWSVGVMRGSGGHIGIGPSLEYDAVWSRPFEAHGLVASLRVAFYSGQ
ncbi:MAG TPA: hypothetical protein VHS09_04010 [Polyangiaceae bacterium]|nr:hypothetical protein [Polyangiaceae bacterium]